MCDRPSWLFVSFILSASVVRLERVHGESSGSKTDIWRDTPAWLKGLASGDQRRRTGSGNALEACSRRYAILIHSLLTYLLTYLLWPTSHAVHILI